MEKKNYETPELHLLGSVRELTTLTSPPTECSAIVDFTSEDAVCETHTP